MVTRTKAQRSASAKKAARTRKRNEAAKKVAAPKRKAAKRRAAPKRKAAKRRAAPKRKAAKRRR